MPSTTPQAVLTGATGAGAGAAIDFTDAKSRVTMVLVPTGTITSGQVALEASHDNLNWVALYIFDARRTSVQYQTATHGAFRYYRANIIGAIVGGGSVSATLMEAG